MKQIVSALIFDEHGRVFVQKRAATRRLFPGCWDVAGGHVHEGETPADALFREVREETGWLLSEVLAELETKRWFDGDERVHERQFICAVEGDLQAPQLEQDKVSEFRWLEAVNVDVLLENREEGDTFIFDTVVEAFNMNVAPKPKARGKRAVILPEASK